MSATTRDRLSHKERLLREGMKLFYANGFHGTSVDAVLAAAEVPKGSFYHHFGSKEAFAQTVLERYGEFQTQLLDKWAHVPDLSTSGRIVGYFEESIKIFVNSDYRWACLAGKLSTEVAAESAVFRRQIAEGFYLRQSQFATMIAAGQAAGDVHANQSAEALAAAVFSLIQGAFVIALSTRDDKQLAAVGSTIKTLIDAPAPFSARRIRVAAS